MKFKPTDYRLMNVSTGRIFDDEGWTLADPQATSPALVRAIYSSKQFNPRTELKGLYRYADWMPINHLLDGSSAPVTIQSKGLARELGLNNLYLTISGYCPEVGAEMSTCSFKETEAFSVCARLPKNNKKILIIQSAGNTARAFAKVCSDNRIPVVICIPEDNKIDMWFTHKLNSCVKVIAAPSGSDYYDAIALGEKLAQDDRFLLEGGAKNVARRDGMGTTLLSAVETIGRIPDAYFQAVGSGTGAIAAWENNLRLIEDGRYGNHKMKIFVSQNRPYNLMYDSWKAGSRNLVAITPEESRRASEVILAKVLSNRKPPYSIAGGLYDALSDSNGDVISVSNDDVITWLMRTLKFEGFDVLPAAAVAIASLAQAVEKGQVNKDDVIMVNVTGSGLLRARKKTIMKEPDMVISPDLPAEEIIRKVSTLF